MLEDCYWNLAQAIILQACDDYLLYRKSKRDGMKLKEVELFFLNRPWDSRPSLFGSITDLDGADIMKRLDARKDGGKIYIHIADD